MKVYYLHLTEADFTQDGLVWTTDVIDLYKNAWYTNYSSTKSAYGLNSLGDRTWTGLAETGTNLTDAGEIDSGRFIDYTGRINILNHELDISNALGTSDIRTTVTVYTAPTDAEPFPDGYAQKTDIDLNRSILWTNTYRYARFELTFETDQDISAINIQYDVRIEIDMPVIDPMFARTRTVMNKFPEWMAIRDDSIEQATPELATPNTLGGALVNAVAGEWLDKLDSQLVYIRLQRYITTADPNQVAWVYYAANVPEIIYSIEGDGERLTACANLIDFYEADEDDFVYWWDENRQVIYTRIQYSALVINGTAYDTSLQQVWNWFDEHGLIVDLYRHHGESNDLFRKRILDVYINKPGVALDAFKLALRRELNLWYAFDGATPDSYALGATPEVLEIPDIETSDEFVNPNGMPTDKFRDLVEYLAERYPTTWGFFKWDRAMWDIGGDDHVGYGILPYQYDATPYPADETQSGIGDGNDLFVYRPDDITGPREFNYRFKVRGRTRTIRDEYPAITILAEFYAQADKTVWDNPTLTPWFTVTATTPTNTYYLPVQASVKSDVDNDTPSPTESSFYTYEILGEDHQTLVGQTWYAAGDPTPISSDDATPNYIDLSAATEVSVQWGRYDPDTATFTDFPVTSSATLWFADAEGDDLAANSSSTEITAVDPISPSPIIIRSDTTSDTVGTWESEHQPLQIVINGQLPDNSFSNTTITAPTVMWDPYLESTPNKKYIVKIALIDPDGNYIVTADDPNSEENILLDHTIISINGSNSWSDGALELDADTNPTLEFSSGINDDYPVETSVWELFEATEDELRYAVVDENGPWRDGVPQEEGAYNFLLDQIDIGREEFGLSSSADYIITWIGPEVVDDSRVIIWVDCNTVNPATDDENAVVYPENAVIESYDSGLGNYVFSPFFVRARLRPDVDPQWYPQVHSGWFYEREKEYYLYADPVTETATATDWTLQDVARLGAPIIIKTDEATPVEYRQVAFTHDATPTLVDYNTETIVGNGSDTFYLAYEGVFDVTITNLSTGEAVTADTYSDTNEIVLASDSNKTDTYEVSYKVDKSFYAEHDYIDNGENKTHISIIERTPYGGDYVIDYEGSDYNPATPVDLSLNTFYTSLDEGFIFLSHDQYDLGYVEVRISPTKVIADGEDYLLLSLKSFDVNYNMKPYQEFTLTTTFGTFRETNTSSIDVTTDKDGFATAVLISEVSTTELNAYVEIDGPGLVDATVNYEIDPVRDRQYRLLILPSADQIQADGESEVVVFGKVEDDQFQPVPYATISWKRDRSMSEVFQAGFEGQVTADDRGYFSIGPFTAATPDDTGFWFMVAESWFLGASPSGEVASPDFDSYDSPEYGPIGDVIFWYEYPDARFGVNDSNELPRSPVQMQVNPYDTVYYSNQNAFPVTYDEDSPYDSATPVTLDYEPPKWYAIDRYTQYQLGLLGTGFYDVDLTSYNDAPPDSKDV